jgi:hypothetical protein
MKETKLKRLIKKMMDCVFLDAMTPEFKAANAELLKAIKMNDKSGAVPHADLEAVNKAMKENDADKAGAALKKVQLQFSKAEKKLDDDVKSIQAKLETTKKAAETAKASLKQKKALASVFDKLKTLVAGLSNNPKNASKLTALTDKVKDYGDLSKRASQIITLVSSNKDASKQIDMLKKSVDAAEKKFKKDLANAEKESKKADDALEVAKMQVKITQGKKDAFTKERLYIANVVKQMPQGDLRQSGVKTNPVFEQMIKAKKFIENDIKNEMNKQVKIMKEKQKKYYENTEDYSDDLKEASRLKNNLLSDIKSLVAKAKESGLSPKCIKVANDVANLVKKGDSRWDSPNVVKENILRNTGRNMLSLTKEKQNEFRALAEMVRSGLAVYQKFVFSGGPERSRQLLSGGKKTVVEYMKTPEGDNAYQEAFQKIGKLAIKIKDLFPNFKANNDVRIFKWDYFEKPSLFIAALLRSLQDSFEDSM